MSFTTLTQLINFLTRPLILTHPVITVAHLQLVLQANLSSFLPFTPVADASLADDKNQKFVLSPFTLHLSPLTLPIPPIYAGCLSSGISWDGWIRVLTAGLGNDVYVFIMEGCIRVGVPKMDIKEGEQGLDMIELWREPEEKSEPSPMALKLRATLSSVHACKVTAQASAPFTTTFPRTRSSSPDSTVESSPSSSTSSDVDYDSDNESTTSSSYFAVSKLSSRFSIPAAASAVPVVSRQRAPRPTTSKTTFVSRHKAESHKPQSTPTTTTTLRTPAPKSRYMYEGGEKGVVTGGVMLGSPSPDMSTTTTTTTLRSSGSKGAKEGSWRASSFGSSKGTKKNASATVSENWRRD
ncbi:hypothetical protein K435DRAFT_886675 [Dendrothele bispora CBS 962.96]|uniref:Uncharacterized protein n=1 Tax=Dendrothele bispora (strain CBS 962.96) TaxID=1314807 RepID=A0A4S8M6Q2_DENBC|nr:hypothetical protein K435DRAFT_886675 [Dendrothele bispora CBS 962.96]